MTTNKRGRYGDGSIFPRKDSSRKVIGYVAQLSIPKQKTSTGKRKRIMFYGATKADVQERMQRAREKYRNSPVPSHKLTVEVWLQRWLEDQLDTRHTTLTRYRGLVEKYMIPFLGKIPLEKLEPGDVRSMLKHYAAPPGVDVKRHKSGLGPQSLHHLRAVLRTALNQAIKDGKISRNAAALADPPKVPRKEMSAFDPDQATAFLAAIQGHPFEALFTLALSTGMRKGEVLGLRWSDVDLDNGTLHVTKTLQRINQQYRLVDPKTELSGRVVPLPPIAVEALKAQRAKQSALELKAKPGHWMNTLSLVFTTAYGAPQDGSVVTHEFQDVCDKAGLPVIRFHDLRHSFVSLVGGTGVDVAVVSKMIGHSTITLTLNTYRHVFDKAQREAANAIDRVLSGPA